MLRTLDLETNKKIEKMFLIIGSASMPLLSELEIIRRNEMYLITNDIFTVEELNEIYVSINQHVDLLKTPATNYGAALSFLLYGYQKVYEWGHFDQDIMVISWQHSKNVVELLIEKRTKQSAHQTEEPQVQNPKQHKKRKRKKR